MLQYILFSIPRDFFFDFILSRFYLIKNVGDKRAFNTMKTAVLFNSGLHIRMGKVTVETLGRSGRDSLRDLETAFDFQPARI